MIVFSSEMVDCLTQTHARLPLFLHPSSLRTDASRPKFSKLRPKYGHITSLLPTMNCKKKKTYTGVYGTSFYIFESTRCFSRLWRRNKTRQLQQTMYSTFHCHDPFMFFSFVFLKNLTI